MGFDCRELFIGGRGANFRFQVTRHVDVGAGVEIAAEVDNPMLEHRGEHVVVVTNRPLCITLVAQTLVPGSNPGRCDLLHPVALPLGPRMGAGRRRAVQRGGLDLRAAKLHPGVIDDFKLLALGFLLGQFGLVGVNFGLDFSNRMTVEVHNFSVDGALLFQKSISPTLALTHENTSSYPTLQQGAELIILLRSIFNRFGFPVAVAVLQHKSRSMAVFA